MYKLVAGISSIIRQFCSPNPFEPRPDAWFLNLIAEPFVHLITYVVTGLFYRSGSAPALGSLLYLTFYYVHTGLIMLMGYFQFTKIAIIIIVVLYIIILCAIRIGLNSIENFSRGW